MISEQSLSEILDDSSSFRLVEPHIYSTFAAGEDVGISYDKRFGYFYDLVACSPAYNFIVWGYRIREYHSFCLEALESSGDGWVLDAGCGSLAFTARTYAGYSDRPVVLLDRSLRLLRIAKARLAKRCGEIPPNLVLVHGDALQLPFKPGSFATIISLNLLHVFEDVTAALLELKRVLADGGTMSLTTLVENQRLADRYLHLWGRAGELIPRTVEEVLAAFEEVALPTDCRTRGNLAFIRCR
jgi:ubiquinone/menaquinone biosynthesis C-methylase UbiE